MKKYEFVWNIFLGKLHLKTKSTNSVGTLTFSPMINTQLQNAVYYPFQ